MKPSATLAICTNQRLTGRTPSCGARNAAALADSLEHALKRHGLPLTLVRSDCLGRCTQGPNLRLAPIGAFGHLRDEEDIPQVLQWLERELG